MTPNSLTFSSSWTKFLCFFLFTVSAIIAGAWRRARPCFQFFRARVARGAQEGNAPRSSWGDPVSTVTLALDFFLPVVVAARGASVDVSGGSHSSVSFVFLRYHFQKRFERQTYFTEWFGQNVRLKLTLRFG